MESQKDFFSEAECNKLSELMARKHQSFLNDRHFEIGVTLSHKPDAVCVKVLLRNKSGSFYYPVEARMTLDQDMTKEETGYFLIDYIDVYFEEYLADGGDVYLPIDWTDFECEGKTFQLKGQVFNLELEQKADELLSGR